MESSASYGQLALGPLMDVPAAPSPLSGAYLLIVVGEPHSPDHRHVILNRIAKGTARPPPSDMHKNTVQVAFQPCTVDSVTILPYFFRGVVSGFRLLLCATIDASSR